MNYIDALDNIASLFENGKFALDRWNKYAADIFPQLAGLCLEDIKGYDFNKDIVPNLWENTYRLQRIEK